MTPAGNERFDLRALLEGVEAASPVDSVEVLATLLARMVGARDVSFLAVDLSGDSLIRFVRTADAGSPARGRDDLFTVPLSGSPHERAIRSQAVVTELDGGPPRLYAPVTQRGEPLGVLELELRTPPDEGTERFVGAAAHALAFVMVANGQHTDVFERGRRSFPFTLAAEIQRRLLPPAFTCEDATFTVAGWLEPANDVGGDTFDYSVERDVLHVSISDAMGHTVAAAQLATLAVGSLRNSRRGDLGPAEQAEAANGAVLEHGGEDGFISALLLRVDLMTGRIIAVNAGHPLPYLLRDGEVAQIELEADLPFGMLPGARYREQDLSLEPGDRLVLITDGMQERNAASLDIPDALVRGTHLHPREVVHSFARAVVGATGGSLEDDATVLCLDWYGPQRHDLRRARAGASRSRATAADATDEQAGLVG
jgi:hypothetical protein